MIFLAHAWNVFGRKVNAQVSKFVWRIGRIVVHHKDLEGMNDDLLRPDSVSLNNIDIDFFF